MLEGRTPGVLREEEWVFQKSAKKERNNAKMNDPTKRALGGMVCVGKAERTTALLGTRAAQATADHVFYNNLGTFPPNLRNGQQSKKRDATRRRIAGPAPLPLCLFALCQPQGQSGDWQ